MEKNGFFLGLGSVGAEGIGDPLFGGPGHASGLRKMDLDSSVDGVENIRRS